MRQQFKILVEYEPGLPVEYREEVDKKQIGRLIAEHPGWKVVGMARQLISDHRAFLYAEMEPK